jgi:glycosyltransferase involved in cell wall biosynthesis
MRICRVSRSFPPKVGGLERHVEMLSRSQARRGDDVWVLQPVDQGVPEPGLTLVRVGLGPIAPWIHGGRTAAKAATTAFAARAAAAARRLHRGRRFDMVHLHGDVIEAMAHAAWASARGVPIVLTLHSSLNQRALYRRLAAAVFRHLNGFIAVSEEIRRDLVSVGVESDRIAVIPSGLDVGRFRRPTADERRAARAALQLQDDETAVVTVGRAHAVKGHHVLLRAVADRRPPDALRLFVIGDGPQARALREQARSLPHVDLVGGLDHAAVVTYLHAADIFVLASVDLPGVREGTPTAVLEAMACGLPVVCTDAGGLRHLVRDGENGLIVSQGDPAGLRAALVHLAQRPSIRRLFGERNAERARERAWPNVTERVADFYSLVSAARAARGAVARGRAS